MTINWSITGIWILRIVAAGIMLQTLYFKFTAAEESVYIFSQLGMEPLGRIVTGILELFASALILFPRTTHLGSVMAMGLMGGAIFFHLTKLGISVQQDKGQLFLYALIVFLSAAALALVFRSRLLSMITK